MNNKILYLLNLFFSLSFCFKCGHDKIKKAPKILNITIPQNDKSRRLDSYHPISFYVDYTQMENDQINYNLNSSYINFLKSALQLSLEIFSELLQVKLNGNTVIKEPDKCGEKIKYYNNQIKSGVDNDIILVPIIDKTLDIDVLAAAAACFLNKEDIRPIMGYILINPVNDDYESLNSKEYFALLFLHEITHILVFLNDLYKYYLYSGSVTTKKIINGKERTLISTPKVKNIAAQHFNCSSIIGVELENQGGSGSVGSHWETRVMLGDYMMSSDYGEIVISDITLALFEDSGWYEVNYYTAGLFRFGKGQGCEFLNSVCASNGNSNFKFDFCDFSTDDTCSPNNLNRGYCYWGAYREEIDSEYQYSDKNNTGGYIEADYCPIPWSYVNTRKSYFYKSCTEGEINYSEKQILGFSISNNSICIISSLDDNLNSRNKNYERALCHKIACNYDKHTFNVDIGKQTIECPNEGGQINVEGYKGSIICPPYNRVCTSEVYTGNPIKAVLNHISNSDIDTTARFPHEKNLSNFLLNKYLFLLFIFV